MGNMSYCRFENTLKDLRDCADNLNDDLSRNRSEARSRLSLIKVCKQIVNNAEEDIEEFQIEYDTAKQYDQ